MRTVHKIILTAELLRSIPSRIEYMYTRCMHHVKAALGAHCKL